MSCFVFSFFFRYLISVCFPCLYVKLLNEKTKYHKLKADIINTQTADELNSYVLSSLSTVADILSISKVSDTL